MKSITGSCASIFTLLMVMTPSRAVQYPVGITNCDVSSWIPKSPKRAVTLNQGTTEIMLALGLTDRMVGTAYLDDEIWPLYEEEYKKVPVLSEAYPDIDTLMNVKPDFLYGSYMSAFSSNSINYTTFLGKDCELVVPRRGEDRAYCRPELHETGIQTYLQSSYCEEVEHRPETLTVEGDLFGEIWDIASIFNVRDKARALIDDIDFHFDQALEVSKGVVTSDQKEEEAIRVLWLDGWDEDKPFVGSCCGSVQTILEYAGAKNIFDELGLEERSSWDYVSWADIAAADPDVIVLVDASWDPAGEKIQNLCSHSIASQLRAVKRRAYISVPFSGSTLGVRIGSLSYNLAEAILAVSRNYPLPSVEFSSISLTMDDGEDKGGKQAVTNSGVKVYTRLPVWNGTDLEATCATESSSVEIKDIVKATAADDEDADGLSTGWTVLIGVLAVVAVATVAILLFMIRREQNGKPVFEQTSGTNA